MKDREMILEALASGKPARVGLALLMASGYAVAALTIVGGIIGAAYVVTAQLAGRLL